MPADSRDALGEESGERVAIEFFYSSLIDNQTVRVRRIRTRQLAGTPSASDAV